MTKVFWLCFMVIMNAPSQKWMSKYPRGWITIAFLTIFELTLISGWSISWRYLLATGHQRATFHNSNVLALPWTANMSSLGSNTGVLLSWPFLHPLRLPLLFLLSPQRLEPPCMLGMLRMAMPSKEMLLRSRVTPSHFWGEDIETDGRYSAPKFQLNPKNVQKQVLDVTI